MVTLLEFFSENGPLVEYLRYGAICKTIFSPKISVMLKILSSEYRFYACGKIIRMPRYQAKMPGFR
jgi:hypothetical protein